MNIKAKMIKPHSERVGTSAVEGKFNVVAGSQLFAVEFKISQSLPEYRITPAMPVTLLHV